MPAFNRVILMGNLTRDVELRHLQSGTCVGDTSIAINDKRKGDNGEWIEDVTFVELTLWGRTAEIANEYLSKGSPALIEGRLKLEQWDDKNGGGKRSKLKVVVERLQLLGQRGGQENSGGSRSNQGDAPPPEQRQAPRSQAPRSQAPTEDPIPF